MAHLRSQLSRAAVLGVVSLMVFACEADQPLTVSPASVKPSSTVTSEVCALDKAYNLGYPPPDSGTVCGVHFTIDEPWLICQSGYTSIHWYSAPAGWPYASAPESRFYVNEYNDKQNGPLDVRFATPVKNVTVGMYGMEYDTHFMVAYNGAGQEIGRKTFVRNGVPDPYAKEWSVETLDVDGIKKVLIYPAWSGALYNCPNGSDQMKDGVVYSLTFEPSHELRVTCPSMPRGGTVNCVATSDPPGNVSVTEWRFINPELTDTITESSGTTTWYGKAVVSGTVRVIGSVDGVTDTAETTLTVTPRNWSTDTVLYSQQEVPQSDPLFNLPNNPIGPQNFGRTIPDMIVDVGSDKAEMATTGPNNGFAYLLKVPVYAPVKIALNRVALQVNSAFYLKQYDKRKQRGGGLKPWCAKSDVVPELTRVIAHEGLGSPPPAGSHAFVFRDEMNRRVPTAIESAAVRGGATALNAKVFEKAQPGWSTAITLADDYPTGLVQPSNDPCEFQYFPAQ
jgi:hypothetical protein